MAENVPTYSRWLLGVYSTPYDHSKKHYGVKSPGWKVHPAAAGSWTNTTTSHIKVKPGSAVECTPVGSGSGDSNRVAEENSHFGRWTVGILPSLGLMKVYTLLRLG